MEEEQRVVCRCPHEYGTTELGQSEPSLGAPAVARLEVDATLDNGFLAPES